MDISFHKTAVVHFVISVEVHIASSQKLRTKPKRMDIELWVERASSTVSVCFPFVHVSEA
jgi:hypothetical protein